MKNSYEFHCKYGTFLYNLSVVGVWYIVFYVTFFRNRDVKVQDDTKQIEEVNVTRHMAKRKRKLRPLF